MLVTGRSFLIPRGIRGRVVVAGVCNATLTMGYLGSVFYIPVSLGALLFYTFPLVVAAVGPLVAKRRLTLFEIIAFPLAFVGLVLVLGPHIGVLDWRGVALATLASVSGAILFLISPRAVAGYHAYGVSLYICCISAIVTIALLPLFGGLVLPVNTPGWIGFTGVCLLYVLATLLLFVALPRAGAVRTALIFNMEPVVAIVGAVAFLGERLNASQMFGGLARDRGTRHWHLGSGRAASRSARKVAIRACSERRTA